MRFSTPPAAVLTLALLAAATPADAQRKPTTKPEKQTLTTKDGVQLGVTYYPSSGGKDAVPVVMLHDYKESRAVFAPLAQRLSSPTSSDSHKPFAVVTVDLRGHGDSVTQANPRGGTRQLEASKLRRGDFDAMVLSDLEAVRKFLVTENDAGRLNLNRLSVIGTGLGAAVGMNWAGVDWSIPPLATVKQGQDIKTMILVSPRWKSNGLSMQNAVRLPGLREKVAMLMLYGGDDRRVTSDVKRVYSQLERYHESPDSVGEGRLPTLMEFGPETELQGTEFLKQAGKKAEDLMIRFLTQHSAEPDFKHIDRRQP